MLLAQGHRTVNNGFRPVGLQNSGSLHIPGESMYSLELHKSIIETLWLRWFTCSLAERCSINVHY